MSWPRRAQFEVVSVERDRIVIRDVGRECLSVTNDAECVVQSLNEQGLLPRGRRLFYYDSNADLDEILINANGEFCGFKPSHHEGS